MKRCFTQTINLALINEFKEIEAVFENDDTFEFELSNFDKSSDINFRKIIDIMKNLGSMMVSILNINAIREEELEK